MRRFWRWREDFGYVDLKPREGEIRAATYAQYADRVSCVVSPARTVTAADRARARERSTPAIYLASRRIDVA